MIHLKDNSLFQPKIYTLLGIPVLFAIGSLFHFLYQLLGENPVIGAIAPVNESVWEHTKMVVLPLMLWWGIYGWTQNKRQKINLNKWMTGGLVSLVVSVVTIPLLFYFYTQAFGVELLWADILILLIALLLGQLVGFHVFRYSKNGLSWQLVLALFVGILLLYILFTFQTPHLPLFQDGMSGSYGLS